MLDQGMRETGQNDDRDQDNQTFTVGDPTISRYGSTTDRMLAELEEAPIVPLAALLCSDASPREIVRRLRLNVAIRMLCEAICESEVAS